ncbi:MAG: hypothetical protein JEZ09_13620 [Salinivirgaceae bacterium]|nr:hypothetical protein [Salinivirgaceae bacterium]
MKLRTCFLFVFLCSTSLVFSQRKSSEHKVNNIQGVAVGSASQTPEEVKQKAINNAKVNALKSAGIEENISSYSDYFRSESDNTMEDLFTSDILSNINGTIKDINISHQLFEIDNEGNIKCNLTINCSVIKYKTKKDLAFDAWVDGIKMLYNAGDGLTFTIKPTKDCFIRAFVFTDKSYVLLPNAYEHSKKLLAQNKYTFPDPKIMDPYELTLESEKKDKELNRLVLVFLKEDIYYTGKINYKDITSWIMSIPPDDRIIKYYSYAIYKTQ